MNDVTRLLTCNIFARDEIEIAHQICWRITWLHLNSICNIYGNIAGLENDLRHSAWGRDISILLADRPSDLNQFIKLSGWFESMSLILMIPDQQPDTITQAHLMRPRFLIPPPINFNELWLVVQHLIKKGLGEIDQQR